jgi:Protein of unknown function (DUF1579)
MANEHSHELANLDPFIGRWITDGETAPGPDGSVVAIHASDVYEWAPGGRFALHLAYGRFGDDHVGGTEIIGLNPAGSQFSTHFFDAQGNISTQTLSLEGGRWCWRGSHTRCNGAFSPDGLTLVARHERLAEDGRWVPSMTVTLRKVI